MFSANCGLGCARSICGWQRALRISVRVASKSAVSGASPAATASVKGSAAPFSALMAAVVNSAPSTQAAGSAKGRSQARTNSDAHSSSDDGRAITVPQVDFSSILSVSIPPVAVSAAASEMSSAANGKSISGSADAGLDSNSSSSITDQPSLANNSNPANSTQDAQQTDPLDVHSVAQPAAINKFLPVDVSGRVAQRTPRVSEPPSEIASASDRADECPSASAVGGSDNCASPAQISPEAVSVLENLAVENAAIPPRMLEPDGNLSRSSSKIGQTKSMDSPNLDLALTSAKTQQKGSTAQPIHLTSQSAETSAQSTGQHSQADASQVPVDGPAEARVVQSGVFISQLAGHDASGSQHSARSTDPAPQGSTESGKLPQPQFDRGDMLPAASINTARVIQTMSESEMRVGMHSSDFGDISIRTSVSQQQMMAQISVDHRDLSSAISARIPAVQAKLGNEFGLNASIEVSQTSMSFSGDRGQSQQEQKPFVQSVQISGGSPEVEVERVGEHIIQYAADDASRLDIRA